MELQRILCQQEIRTVFQPIVSLVDGSIFGYEALSRGPVGSPLESPVLLFNRADQEGMTWELEYTCRRLAIERFASFKSPTHLFLNVNPHVIDTPRFREGMTEEYLASQDLSASRVIIELTEQAIVSNTPEFLSLLDYYKGQGFRLAVDDVGAGYSGLTLICHIKPQFLKLDMALVRHLHRDVFKQQMVKNIVNFAKATQISVIAEGIEEPAELLAVLELGVEYGQGFLFAKPQPIIPRIPDDLVEYLRSAQQQRVSRVQRYPVNTRVGSLARAIPPCPPSMLVSELEKRFIDDEGLLGVPIVKEGIPVGLVMRDKLFTQLGRRYGYSLFHHRTVDIVMDTHPMAVESYLPLEEVAQIAARRQGTRLYDHVLVTLQGSYTGVVTVRDLLESLARQGIQNATQANPLTGLPGNPMIQGEIERVISGPEAYAILYLDLDNFKAYNDTYGFDRGDAILRFFADLLRRTFLQPALPEPFVGHLGGDDFIVVVHGLIPEAILDQLIRDFDTNVPQYYEDEDRQRGFVYAINRKGEEDIFPLISLSVAVLTSKDGPFDSYPIVAKRVSEIKQVCKLERGSCYRYDLRGNDSITEMSPDQWALSTLPPHMTPRGVGVAPDYFY